MIKKKIIVLALGVVLILYLLMGTFLSSSVLSFTTDKFREKCLWQTKYIATSIEPSLPPNLKEPLLQQMEAKLTKEHGIKVELLSSEPKAMEEELRQALLGKDGVRIINGEQGKAMLIAVPLSNGILLRTTNSMASIEKEEEEIRIGILLAALVILGLGFYILERLIAKQTAPLELTSRYVKEYLAGQETIRLPLNDNGEFGILAYGFNTLADNYSDVKLELQKEEHKNHIILNNMDNAMAVIAKEGNVLECNKQFTQWFSTKLEDGTNSYKEFLAHSNIIDFLQQCLAKKDGHTQVFNLIQNKNKRVYKVFGAPLQEAFQSFPTSVLMVFHDITTLQEMYDKQTTFVSNASHELSTPLTTIRGFADTLLEDDTGSNPELRQQFLQIILAEAKRMQELIKDLLQLARLDQADYRQSMTIEAFAVDSVLTDLEAELSGQASKRALTLNVDLGSENLDVEVLANRDWLKQILLNLTENALKYTPPHGQIDISYTVDEPFVEFTVHNTGEGINQEDCQKIFDRFYRIDKARSRAQGGSGLGLSIVKFIVEILGGTIKAVSSKGQGVSFIFTMPLNQKHK